VMIIPCDAERVAPEGIGLSPRRGQAHYRCCASVHDADAIRRLVELGLAADSKPKKARS
jgi:hypothetical protein